MAGLPRSNLFVPVGGLQTDFDDKVLPLGRMIDLENCYVMRKGQQDGTCEAIKRFGTKAMPAPGNVTGQLATHLNALVDAGVPLKTLATSTDTTWRSALGDMRPGLSYALTKVSANALTGQIAVGAGYFWIAYTDSGTTIHGAAVDTTTGHRAFSTAYNLTGGATAWASWRVVFVAGKATFVLVDNLGTIYYDVVDPATMTDTVYSSATVANVAINDSTFDAYARGSIVAVAFRGAASNNVACIDFDPATGSKTAWTPNDSGAAAIPINNGSLSWMLDFGGSGKVALITASPAQALKVQWDFPTTGATRQAVSTYAIDGGFTVTSGFVAGHTVSTNATGEFVLVWDSGATKIVKCGSRLGGVISIGLLARGTNIRSRTWAYGGDGFVVVGTSAALGGTHYVLRIVPAPPANVLIQATPAAIIGVRQSNGKDGTGAPLHGLSSVAVLSATQVAVALNYQLTINDQSVGMISNPDANALQYATIQHPTYPQSKIGVGREVIGSLLMPGGQLAQFDGVAFEEAGFAYPPTSPGSNPPGAGGGLTASSNYWYSLVYSYVDAQGHRWQSAHSVPTMFSTGVGQGTINLVLPTLTIAGRYQALAGGVQIEIYRGQPNDAVLLQKVGVALNDPTVDSVTFADTMTDAVLAAQEFLYTTGNVLDNDTPPGFISIVEAQNRTWGISMDDPQVLWPSKEHDAHGGVGFSEAIAFNVRDIHGPMRALAQIDGRVVVFKDDAVYGIGGQGPDNLGNGGSYQAQQVCVGIGCSNAQSICETKDGVIFRSTSQRAGFFLLDRGLSVSYIGAGVQRYNNETITSSVFLFSLLQARFYTASGRTLVYDLVTGIWTTFTGQPCATATSWNGIATFLSTATSHILYEDVTGTTLTDDGVATTMLIGWPWLQLNQVRGYQRFYRMQPTFEVLQAAVMMNIKLYRDLNTTSTVIARLSTPPGTTERELHYSAKMGSLKAVMTDGGSTTGILKVSGITHRIGLKKGTKPSQAANRLT